MLRRLPAGALRVEDRIARADAGSCRIDVRRVLVAVVDVLGTGLVLVAHWLLSGGLRSAEMTARTWSSSAFTWASFSVESGAS